jgi:simple sugar transport system permease protein
MGIDLIGLLASTLRQSTPLVFGSLGAITSERAGVVNIAIEGMLLMSAFFGMLGAHLTGSPWIGLLFALIAGTLMGLVHAIATVTFHANHIISGLALNLIATGGTGYLLVQIFGRGGTSPPVDRFEPIELPVLGAVPWLGEVISPHSGLVYLSFGLAFAMWIVLMRTPFGLRVRSSGELPRALDTAGVSVTRIRYSAVVLSGFICGFGGAFLSLSLLNVFTEGMTSGRGFIAIAAGIFGRWHPIGALGASLFFGLATALTQRLPQGVIDRNLLFMLPYILTIFALASFGGRAVAPASIGEHYRKE